MQWVALWRRKTFVARIFRLQVWRATSAHKYGCPKIISGTPGNRANGIVNACMQDSSMRTDMSMIDSMGISFYLIASIKRKHGEHLPPPRQLRCMKNAAKAVLITKNPPQWCLHYWLLCQCNIHFRTFPMHITVSSPGKIYIPLRWQERKASSWILAGIHPHSSSPDYPNALILYLQRKAKPDFSMSKWLYSYKSVDYNYPCMLLLWHA